MMTGSSVVGQNVVVVPILRAGLGMARGFLRLLPTARVGHVGMARDEESLQPVEYYYKVPETDQVRHFVVLDPMLATGGSAVATIDGLKARGARDLVLMCLVAAPEGVRALAAAHPDVHVFAAALDRQLNDAGYILPGLGDAGDRMFGTG
jgi:uracil phosphoribosyltransferase